MSPADPSRPTAGYFPARRIVGRVAGVNVIVAVLLALAISTTSAEASAVTRPHAAAPAALPGAATGSATAAPTPSSSPVTAPASTPALPSHGNDVPAPGFTQGDGGGTLQAVLVVAIPAVPAIVMAFVVFWPRTRQPRSRPVRTGRRSATTSGAGT